MCQVEKKNFIPAPKIDSSVLSFKRRDSYSEIEAKRFLSVTSAGFSAPRKKVLSNLANALHMEKEILQEMFNELGLLETARAEEMDIQKWKELIVRIDAEKNLEDTKKYI